MLKLHKIKTHIYLQNNLDVVGVAFALLVSSKLWATIQQWGGHSRLVRVDRGRRNKRGRGWAGRAAGTAALCSDRHDERWGVTLSYRHELCDRTHHNWKQKWHCRNELCRLFKIPRTETYQHWEPSMDELLKSDTATAHLRIQLAWISLAGNWRSGLGRIWLDMMPKCIVGVVFMTTLVPYVCREIELSFMRMYTTSFSFRFGHT